MNNNIKYYKAECGCLLKTIPAQPEGWDWSIMLSCNIHAIGVQAGYIHDDANNHTTVMLVEITKTEAAILRLGKSNG